MLPRSRFPRDQRTTCIFHLAFFSLSAVLALVLLADATVVFAQSQDANPKNRNSQRLSERAGAASDVARGKYLVEGVAICGECHTPKVADHGDNKTSCTAI